MTDILPKMSETTVPGRNHYSLSYMRGGRVFSYAHQIDAALSFGGRQILEVGVGAGVVAAALRSMGMEVTTLDLQENLSPNLVGSVTDIPAEDAQFDMAICCHVLEHLPYDQFTIALRELRRVTRRGIVLSLPDITRHYYIRVRLPKIKDLSVTISIPKFSPKVIPRKRLETSGHFWEIGFKGYSLSVIQRSIKESGRVISKTWRVPEMPWHRFFILVKEEIK
jgi:ubiquinone/menaquinone biosynthesis C-methylase UbiE